MNNLQFLTGRLESLPKSKISWFKRNRKMKLKHVQKLSKLLKEYNLLRPFIVFDKNDMGFYDLADVSHLKGAIDDMHPEIDFNLPCYILDFIDPNDDDKKQLITILLNKNIKDWNVADFCFSYSIRDEDDNVKDSIYSQIYNDINGYKKRGLSMGVVCAAYTKETRMHAQLKDGDFVRNIKDERFTKDILEYFCNLTGKLNTKGQRQILDNVMIRVFVANMWKTIIQEGHDWEKWETLKRFLAERIVSHAYSNTLPVGDKKINAWYANQLKGRATAFSMAI